MSWPLVVVDPHNTLVIESTSKEPIRPLILTKPSRRPRGRSRPGSFPVDPPGAAGGGARSTNGTMFNVMAASRRDRRLPASNTKTSDVMPTPQPRATRFEKGTRPSCFRRLSSAPFKPVGTSWVVVIGPLQTRSHHDPRAARSKRAHEPRDRITVEGVEARSTNERARRRRDVRPPAELVVCPFQTCRRHAARWPRHRIVAQPPGGWSAGKI